ncbi:WYL domain-containing protein [uncultured Thiocystis sp.]|jgi:predicted DNA-binding transcriptional regulator YafY|uniref:helix-turn-helix transcriptional regulator n=1 Tax=uncultured Thiocystis sp. TaxID=1202134 RepID=UPI0025E203E0|nr:WYL domain-containing protein [uncultured Thiocystis sp.]
MIATHDTRIKRLKRLVALLPAAGTGKEHCPDGQRLLAVLGEDYGTGDAKARRRSLQLDLKDLVEEGRIEAANPGGKPRHYRRAGADPADAPLLWQYTLQQIQDLVADAVPQRQLNRVWERLLAEDVGPRLDRDRLRIVPDTLRLQPVELSETVLMAVIDALANGLALEVRYRSAGKTPTSARLHPQALVQRGPIPYLLALKNREEAPVRLYALHRMLRATALVNVRARQAEDFDLDVAMAEGVIDFGQGDWIDLELRVRGYLTDLLTVCPLEPGQRWEDEPDGAAFAIRVWATLPSTGQLLRWLLGAGDNVEVVAPADLRQTVAMQAAKVAGIYSKAPGAAVPTATGVSGASD